MYLGGAGDFVGCLGLSLRVANTPMNSITSWAGLKCYLDGLASELCVCGRGLSMLPVVAKNRLFILLPNSFLFPVEEMYIHKGSVYLLFIHE